MNEWALLTTGSCVAGNGARRPSRRWGKMDLWHVALRNLLEDETLHRVLVRRAERVVVRGRDSEENEV
jgi:hypothetical protein